MNNFIKTSLCLSLVLLQCFAEAQMVNQLQPSSTLGTLLGQGIQRGLEQGGQVQFQRNLLQDALNKAKKVLNDPTIPLNDKYFEIMKAGAGVPGFETYSVILFEMVSIQQAAQKQQINRK